ncbi:hypothetical protein GS575_33220 [Rhodococcus hoagii]|nr:hypothetical protein [Prescottella equi]
MSASHLNQKPLTLMERIIKASTNPGDVVWGAIWRAFAPRPSRQSISAGAPSHPS